MDGEEVDEVDEDGLEGFVNYWADPVFMEEEANDLA